jgi:hypothetical protein
MGWFDSFFKKEVPIINSEDVKELREIERKAYMEEGKKLMETRGKEKAKKDLTLKKESWEIS